MVNLPKAQFAALSRKITFRDNVEMDTQTLKDVAPLIPLATPFINAVIETHLKPKLSKIFRKSSANDQVLENAFCSKFIDYLKNAEEKHKYLTVLIFNNKQQFLEDLYIPMRVVCNEDKINILIDGYKDEFIPKYKKVLITDNAGMGKSTVMKFLFMSCLKMNIGIPIFIDLRKLEKDKSIVDFILSELNPIDEEFDKEFIVRLIKKGDFIFFLDGYDEIPFDQKSPITNNLQEFISKASGNYFIMTSRPESSLSSFASFKGFKMRPLTEEEAFTLIRKYDADRGVAQELINKLREETSLKEVKEFLGNPLLVSLLYKSYEYKQTIPLKKHIFYRQVYDSLFEGHDLSKEGAYMRIKFSKLDIEDFHKTLRILGFITVKAGKVEYGKDELIEFIKMSKQQCPGLEFKESDLLRDLLQTVPLFNKEGNFYKWSHKSIQDYFAAQFICIDSKGRQEQLLLKIYESEQNEKYYNILDLCYDIDYKTFRSTVIYKLICDFLSYHENSYTSFSKAGISEDIVAYRKALSFGLDVFIPSVRDSAKMKHRELLVEMERAYIQQGRKFEIKGSSINFYSFPTTKSGEATFVVVIRDKCMPVIHMLNKKKSDLIERLPFKPPPPFRPKTSFILDDDPQSLANTKANFESVTTLLSYICNAVALDVKKCRQLKHEIEKEKYREQENDLFLSGI